LVVCQITRVKYGMKKKSILLQMRNCEALITELMNTVTKMLGVML